MPKLVFKGTVLPPGFLPDIEVKPPIRLIYNTREEITADFTIRTVNSELEVECIVDKFDAEKHFEGLVIHAYNLSRAVVDSWCFFTGVGLTVYLGKTVRPDGIERTLSPQKTSLAGLCTAFNINASYKGSDNYWAMLQLIIAEPRILLALNDLVASISHFHLAALNSARALEAIRTAMTPQGIDRDQGWKILQQNLNVTKGYLSLITSESRGPRHGDKIVLGGKGQGEVVARAWKIMNRFLEFRKRGNSPLPESEFPLLDS
jgi:hypothetical protein